MPELSLGPAWWCSVERREPPPQGAPTWLIELQRAHDAELDGRLDVARAHLALVGEAPPAWQPAKRLIELRLLARAATERSFEAILADLAELAGQTSEQSTRARLELARATVFTRLNRLDQAEEAVVEALARVDDAPARTWIVDTFAVILTGQGAWEEARRLLRHVIRVKEEAGDALGIAISTGNLARLELRAGRSHEAARAVSGVLERWASALPPVTVLRLQTALLEVALEGAPEQQDHAAAALQASLSRPCDQSYLHGFAALTLARCTRSREGAREWLDVAAGSMTLPVHRALLLVWRERLTGDKDDVDAWYEASGIDQIGPNTEAEVRAHLLIAERASALGRTERAERALDAAAECARCANNPLWAEWVDTAGRQVDPQRAFGRLLRRYSGVAVEELMATERAEVTVIFADLVGFTARSQEMTPEDVMSTARSLFESTASVLIRNRVRPVNYLGDGLLAIAQGSDHSRRGVACARELIARTNRLSMARAAAGERWSLQLRAGVASGEVVLGPLGNQVKIDSAAIGMPVNLAARLQSSANPGEVVIEHATALATDLGAASTEHLQLKGITGSVAVIRLAAG